MFRLKPKLQNTNGVSHAIYIFSGPLLNAAEPNHTSFRPFETVLLYVMLSKALSWNMLALEPRPSVRQSFVSESDGLLRPLSTSSLGPY